MKNQKGPNFWEILKCRFTLSSADIHLEGILSDALGGASVILVLLKAWGNLKILTMLRTETVE